MTLDNLQLALKLNNEILLAKIKDLSDTISSITGTDLTNIKQEIKDLNTLLEKTKADIDSLNTTTITEINQRLDNIDTALDNIQNTNIPDLDKRIKDNLNAIKELTKSLSDLSSTLDTHIKNTVIHVTQEDKDLWNSILDNAKKYAKKLFDSVTSFNIQIVDTLPVDNIKEMTIYFMHNGRDNETDYYEEYMYINDKWEIIGSTFVNLAPYVLKEDFEKYKQEITDKFAKYNTSDEIINILKDYLLTSDFNNAIKNYVSNQTFNNTIKNYTTTEALNKILEEYAKTKDIHTHENKTIIDKFSESDDGILLFNGQKIKGGSDISQEENNAIQQKDDGIFVEDKTQEIQELQDKILDVGQYVAQVENFEDTPVGHILSFMGTIPPPHYLMCDGTEYLITDYQELADFFIEQYGQSNEFGGDGITTFCVPSLNSSIVLFSDAGNDIINYVKCIKYEPTYYIAYTASYEEINAIKQQNELLKQQNESLLEQLNSINLILENVNGGLNNE